MIVKCASCQTRFKIGDEKVTVRGVKVRCTKCGTIFRVKKDPPTEGALSSAATPLEDLVAAPPPAADRPPTNAGASPAGADALEDIFQSMVPDPTGAGQDRPYEPPPPSDEPAPELPPETDADPSSAGPSNGSAGDEDDPFGLLSANLPAEVPPIVSRRGGTNAPKSPLETLASLDDPFDLPLDPLGKSRTPMPTQPNQTLEDDPFAAFPASTTATTAASASRPSADPSDPLAGLDLDPGRAALPAMPPPEPHDAAEGEPWGENLELDTRGVAPKTRTPGRPGTPAGSPTASLTAETTKVVDGPRPPTNAGQSAFSAHGRPPTAGDGPSRPEKVEVPLGTRVINTIASVSVPLLALLIFVVWRNDGRIDLREPGSAFLAAFGVHRPVPVSQSLPALISGSGLYRSESGLPVLFVRGRVQNLTQRPQRFRVKLTVEDSGRVAAESEAWPSLVPTPDELYAVRSSADLRQLQRSWDDHEPPPLDAQATADFMVVTADLPTNLGGILLKVVAVPQGEVPGHAGVDGGGAPKSPAAARPGPTPAHPEEANAGPDAPAHAPERPAVPDRPAPPPPADPAAP